MIVMRHMGNGERDVCRYCNLVCPVPADFCRKPGRKSVEEGMR